MTRLKSWLLELLLRRRTHAAEVVLGAEALIAGIWVLWPGPTGFEATAWLSLVPEVALGGLLTAHGIGALMALYYGDVHMCRRSALASAAVWAFILTMFVSTPPATLVVLPLVFVLTITAAWVYVRLYLRYPPPGQRR